MLMGAIYESGLEDFGSNGVHFNDYAKVAKVSRLS